jgi:exodeoxyribonuclease-5
MAATVTRTLQIAEIAELRSRLSSEFRVYAGTVEEEALTLTAGIADAIADDDAGHIEVVIDWKSDVNPGQSEIEQYRGQVGDYLAATGARRGLIVFMTSGRVVEVLGVVTL